MSGLDRSHQMVLGRFGVLNDQRVPRNALVDGQRDVLIVRSAPGQKSKRVKPPGSTEETTVAERGWMR
jgi:hypothetical protein